MGLDLEAKGILQPPITRYPGAAAEFLDGNKVPWDVKGFFSGSGKGAFKLVDSVAMVGDELALGENVIIDTTKMNAKDIADLRASITAKGWDARVRWYREQRATTRRIGTAHPAAPGVALIRRRRRRTTRPACGRPRGD